MKRIKLFLCAAAVLCLLLTLLPTAQAACDEETIADKTWEELVDALLEEYQVMPERVAMGYYNTVTGETHYHNGDEYMVAASMYKVPLNMVFAERVANGEMEWTSIVGGYRYETVLRMSIVNSANDVSETLWNRLGGYQKYRKAICPYMGVDPDTVDRIYWKNNYFTAEQMIHCLSLLQSEPERFPKIEEMMKEAEPERYFKAHPQEYEIAHKYGRVSDDGFNYLNDCAICYTDDPICIVLFTQSAGAKAQDFMADFCTLMCDYTQVHTKLRLEAEEKAAEEAAAEEAAAEEAAAEEAAAEEAAALVSAESEPAAVRTLSFDEAEPEGRLVDLSEIVFSDRQLILGALIGAAALIVLVLAVFSACRGRIKGFWAVLTLLLVTLTLLLCVAAPTLTELLNRPEGDPRDAVRGFFDALTEKDYARSYLYLDGYSSLGLENRPDDELSRQVLDALESSYSYRLRGDCTMNKERACQQVLLRHLDLNAVQADLKEATEEALEAKVQLLPRSELYDENGGYLPEVSSAAYADAVSALLARYEDYMTVTALDLELSYGAEGWRIVVDPALTTALCGLPTAKGGT